MSVFTRLAVFHLSAGLSLLAAAANMPPAPQPAPQQQGAMRVPPPEAFSACEGKREGDSVSFTTRRGDTMTGRCKLIPARLAAVPDHPPQGMDDKPQGGPPAKRPQ